MSLLNTIGATSLENFYLAGEAVAHIVNRRLPAGGTALDMGCGCGRNARFLLIRPDITYIGFDVFKPAIEWAGRYLSPFAPGRFRFEHFNAHSAHYNPRGSIKATDVSGMAPPMSRSRLRSSPTYWSQTPGTTFGSRRAA